MSRWRASVRSVVVLPFLALAVVGGTVAMASLAASSAVAAPSCRVAQPTRLGSISGIVSALPSRPGSLPSCHLVTPGGMAVGSTLSASVATPPYYSANGNPPLVNHGGAVMNGSSAVIVTPIYWVPAPFSVATTYQSLTTQFVNDVAAASGSSTNVFSILTQYQPASSTQTSYDISAGSPIVDSHAYPSTGGCIADTGPIYLDNSGYSACVTDPQLRAELTRLGVTTDVHHLYMFLLPQGVETCVTATNGAGGGDCSLNSSTPGFCGYHSWSGSEVYAVLPYAITGGSTGYQCTSQYALYADSTYVGNQTPNSNLEADTVISVMSHEMSEAITDPYGNAWYDVTTSGTSEIGDECAYIYGDSLSMQGASGAQYNQTINGHHYFIQEEFSNSAYNTDPSYGCAQNDQASVVFDANGGSGAMPPQFGLTATALAPNTLTNAGLIFMGWNTLPDGSGTLYANDAIYSFADSITLYAQWGHTVTFDANGGTGTMAPETHDAPTALTSNTFTRAGFTFNGWNTVASGVAGTPYADGASYPFTASTTLYAQWTQDFYTVRFIPNGGTGTMTPETHNAPTALTASSFTRAGFTFNGWNTVASGVAGTAYSDGATYSFTASTILYAQWTANASFTVTFIPNGGTGTMAPETHDAPTVLTSNTFTRGGFTFNGWNTVASGVAGTAYSDGATYPFTTSSTLYAQWTQDLYTVTFDANGGTGTMSPETRNAPTALTPNSFTRVGFTFNGWNTVASGVAGTPYADGASYPFATATTLYAQWAPIPIYAVTFDANGGSGTMAAQNARSTSALTLNTFTRAGYTFSGWNTVADGIGGSGYANGALYSFGTSITLYAQWTLVVPAPPAAPAAPAGLVAKLSGTSITLSWSAPSSGAPPAGYEVYEGSTRGGEALSPVSAGVLVTGLSFMVNAPVPGQTRYFTVASSNAGGTSPHSREVAVTVPRTSSTTMLRIAPSSVSHVKGAHVVFRVTVSAGKGTTLVHGAVRIMSGAKVFCVMVLSRDGTGSCRILTRGQRVGRHSVVAQFMGNASALGSTSVPRTFTVR